MNKPFLYRYEINSGSRDGRWLYEHQTPGTRHNRHHRKLQQLRYINNQPTNLSLEIKTPSRKSESRNILPCHPGSMML